MPFGKGFGLSSERIVRRFIQAARVAWLAVLDLTVGYTGGDNSENQSDQ